MTHSFPTRHSSDLRRAAHADSSDTGADHLSGSKIHDTHPSLGLVRSERSVGRTQCWQNAVMLNCTKLSGVPCSRPRPGRGTRGRSEEHTSELQSLMRISYAVF